MDILPISSVKFHRINREAVVVKSLKIFEKFPSRNGCIEYLEKIRWEGHPKCPYCGSDHNVRMQDRHHCYTCHTSFSVTVGTLFHRTHLPLQTWFLALRLMLKEKKGISALQLSRDLGVNKNTAWRIHGKIRYAMTQVAQRTMLTRIVEMDETNLTDIQDEESEDPIHPAVIPVVVEPTKPLKPGAAEHQGNASVRR